jgi:hypothetical protein
MDIFRGESLHCKKKKRFSSRSVLEETTNRLHDGTLSQPARALGQPDITPAFLKGVLAKLLS